MNQQFILANAVFDSTVSHKAKKWHGAAEHIIAG